jgi:hypothetical protein
MQRVVDYARDHYRGREGGFYCCLSVVDWDQLGVPYGLLTPSITRADATNDKLRSWRVYRQSSVCGALVAKAIESDPSYVVYEGLGLSDIGEMSVQHVYVQASGMALPMGAEVVEPPAPEWW